MNFSKTGGSIQLHRQLLGFPCQSNLSGSLLHQFIKLVINLLIGADNSFLFHQYLMHDVVRGNWVSQHNTKNGNHLSIITMGVQAGSRDKSFTRSALRLLDSPRNLVQYFIDRYRFGLSGICQCLLDACRDITVSQQIEFRLCYQLELFVLLDQSGKYPGFFDTMINQ